MLMPVLRLIGIYIVVGLAIFGLFNRDKISNLFGFGGEATAIEETSEHPNSSNEIVSSDAQPTTNSNEQTTMQNQGSPSASNTEAAVASSSANATSSNEPIFAPLTQPSQQPAQQRDLAGQLDNARRAYWNGDVNSAEAIYRKLVLDQPR